MFPKKVDLENLERVIDKIYHEKQVAFGANFYNWLYKVAAKYDLSLYPPEIFSKYVTFEGSGITVYNNSFDCHKVEFSLQTGCQLGLVRQHFNMDTL